MAIAGEICVICGEPLTETSGADCMRCGQPFHLNKRNDIPGKDCGDVWIDDGSLALDFACSSCLAPAPEDVGATEFSLEDVLDLEEAAEFAGIDEPTLRTMADAGRVRHRKTGGGVYLFRRGDLPSFG